MLAGLNKLTTTVLHTNDCLLWGHQRGHYLKVLYKQWVQTSDQCLTQNGKSGGSERGKCRV